MRYITVAALSHTGLVREHNEDSLVAGPWTLCGTVTENPQTLVFPVGSPLVVAVADGIGGQPGGEVASALTVAHLAALGPSLDSVDAVRQALTRCNRAVYAAAERDRALTAMGTTVAGTVVLPDALLVFNVGDSRVLEAGEDGLRQVSVDDSPPLREGQRTTSLVTQAIGGAPRFSAITPHVRSVPLAQDRRYVVCTDGLTDPVLEEDIAAVLRAHDGGRAVFELWKAALQAGAPDNITLALITVEAEQESEIGGGEEPEPPC
ncbi:PP2C family serine/threonine-protein phosphatase [Streptomyces sp. cg2]|uniref:PP2C family protein-serine/threonine phosphatase n=1 Tax=Streptomyces sp. cg2 TaxID=3238799 RepID=UPI0034E2B0A5